MDHIDLGWGWLVFKDNCAYIVTKKVEYEGKPLSWLTCWRKARFCGLPLHRPHLTCLYCTMRKTANREIPLTLKVTFIVVPVTRPLKGFRRLLVRKLVSLLEFLCRW